LSFVEHYIYTRVTQAVLRAALHNAQTARKQRGHAEEERERGKRGARARELRFLFGILRGNLSVSARDLWHGAI
jgi:hypothetical protein